MFPCPIGAQVEYAILKSRKRGIIPVAHFSKRVSQIASASISTIKKIQGKEYLRKNLHKIGFKWKRCRNKRKILVEREDIILKRI
ncbi:uncharacterized protein LOC129962344 [Argiope bruennichi]|uniref:uncharacterized protein LOC129962344 n=1 Tax=Argiope bruennichi TaxID=94029 RepID=UPI0024945180|nr:uncharacterized protein LOC129962344 [Argiope bruennichi]